MKPAIEAIFERLAQLDARVDELEKRIEQLENDIRKDG